MSAGDWEEVKRLAADFQRAQLSSSIQRLSERNCIEIITNLIKQQLVDVIFTTDGKEYITPQHLVKEIKDELYVHNGRINLVELAKILLVDLSVISLKASEIEKSSAAISLINGQLINSSYLQSLCEEINEKLKIKGQITIAELSSQYDLPSEFLLSVIEKQLGKAIKAQQDKDDHSILFTDDFIKQNFCLVKGALMALTKPTPISTILNLCKIDERLFLSISATLIDIKEVAGTISGKETANGMYVPSIYVKSQAEWVKNFYAQNGYVDFGALGRLGVSNPAAFVKKIFPDGNLVFMASCAVGPLIFDQIEAAIEDVISTASFVNVLPLLPSVAEEKDAEVILSQILKKKAFQNLHTFNSSIIVTDQYLRNLMKKFEKEIEKKAEECVSSGAYLKFFVGQERGHRNAHDDDRHEGKGDRKEERRKKAAEGKGGGGTQGRETKTKSTKKKYMKNVHYEEDDEDEGGTHNKLEILKLEDVVEILSGDELLQEEDSEELIEAIAQNLHPKLQKTALEVAKAHFESSIAATNQNRRKKHNELQEKINDLVLKVRLFEKGYKQFPSKDVQQQLAKYLLKTICTDVANEVFGYIVQDEGKFEGKEMTNELRAKIVNTVPNEMKETLSTLNKSLVSSSVDEFLTVVDAAVGPGFCDILLKKPDKKKERPQLLEQRQHLVDQLNVADDPALVLHLSSLILFQEITQTMLHASGRFVSTILAFLQPSLPTDMYSSLQNYHDLVLKVLTASDPEEKHEAEKGLQEGMPDIKNVTVSFKKNWEKT